MTPPPPRHTASGDAELFVQRAGEGGSAGSVCFARVAASARARVAFSTAFLQTGGIVFRLFNELNLWKDVICFVRVLGFKTINDKSGRESRTPRDLSDYCFF